MLNYLALCNLAIIHVIKYISNYEPYLFFLNLAFLYIIPSIWNSKPYLLPTLFFSLPRTFLFLLKFQA